MVSDLCVWLNGELAATWSHERGRHTLTYARSWVTSKHSRALSLSLPITPTLQITGDAVGNYFDNLLPDSKAIRERLGRRYRVRPNDAFDLLTAIGRDCVGAVQLLPPGTEPHGVRTLTYEPLTEEQIETILINATSDNSPLTGGVGADDDSFRISLAGAQEKTALLRVGNQWCEPSGSTPTTHILKLPMGLVGGARDIDFRDSVENEWLCLRLLALMGLPTARAAMATFGSQKALVVERFDRAWMDNNTWIARLPQEDFCQATGRPPQQKYEKDHGPNIADCMALLGGSENPVRDRLLFLLSQLAFWMLGATDGHAKNFSVFLLPESRYRLTPLYDVISVCPVLGGGRGQVPKQKADLAMAVRGSGKHRNLDFVKPRHWLAEA
jgi:serine/threonine-protein kinase HipA